MLLALFISESKSFRRNRISKAVICCFCFTSTVNSNMAMSGPSV